MTKTKQAVVTATLVFLAATTVSPVAARLSAQAGSTSDATWARQLLESARGANPVICELAMRSVDGRYGNWRSVGRVPDAIIGQRPLVEWLAKDVEGPAAVPVLNEALGDEDTCVRRTAARLLGGTKHPNAVESLLERLEDGDPRTRQAAAVGLGYAEDDRTVDALLDVLSDPVAAVRAAATWALGEIEDERAVDSIARLLESDSDPLVRRQAAWALGNMY